MSLNVDEKSELIIKSLKNVPGVSEKADYFQKVQIQFCSSRLYYTELKLNIHLDETCIYHVSKYCIVILRYA